MSVMAGTVGSTAAGHGPVRAAGLDPDVAARLKRDAGGLVPAVVQQWDTGEVLMVGYMDDEALHRTVTTGRATYWSRSRQQYWRKGDTSGHVQHVRQVRLDCDGDALLVTVDQTGPACHTGARSCFDANVVPVTGEDRASGQQHRSQQGSPDRQGEAGRDEQEQAT